LAKGSSTLARRTTVRSLAYEEPRGDGRVWKEGGVSERTEVTALEVHMRRRDARIWKILSGGGGEQTGKMSLWRNDVPLKNGKHWRKRWGFMRPQNNEKTS